MKQQQDNKNKLWGIQKKKTPKDSDVSFFIKTRFIATKTLKPENLKNLEPETWNIQILELK